MPLSELFVSPKSESLKRQGIIEEVSKLGSNTNLSYQEILTFLEKEPSPFAFNGTMVYPVYVYPQKNGSDIYPGIGHYPKYFTIQRSFENEDLQEQINQNKNVIYLTLANENVTEIFLLILI